MFKIIAAEPLPNYRLRLRYEDGVAGVVNLSHLVGNGVFAQWNEPGAFEQVSLGNRGELRWNDQLDLCPDALYLEITGQSAEEVFPNRRVTANA